MTPRDPPPGFVDLARHVPGIRLAIGYHGSDNFTGAPLPGYEAAGAWLVREAADALARVQEDLAPEGLVVFDAYRPLRACRAMVAWAEREGREDLLRGYISATSRHCRGTAVDVGLADGSGVLDMGGPWDELGPGGHTENAEGEALARRLRLRDAMAARGFAPYHREWWHFEWPMEAPPEMLDVPYGE